MDVVMMTVLACAGLLGIALWERISSERAPEAPAERVVVNVRRS